MPRKITTRKALAIDGHSILLLTSTLLALFAMTAASAAPTGAQLANTVAQAIETSGIYSVRTKDSTTSTYRRIQLEFYDETYPVTIDIVGSTGSSPTKTVYMLPGGSQNFDGSFFTPASNNLAQKMRGYGYLVVGISPRVDKVPALAPNHAFMASWGMAKAREDVRAVVSRIQPVAALPYDMLGYSYGAITALDYAGMYSDDLQRVLVLDVNVLDYAADAAAKTKAEQTYQAHVQLLSQGKYSDDTYAQSELLVDVAQLLPWIDSGIPRSTLGFNKPGNFTFESLLYAGWIFSKNAAGVHTAITGFEGDWMMNKGALAGTYTFYNNPFWDTYSFTKSTLTNVRAGIRTANSGLIPVAFERDFYAISAGNNSAYSINWAGIQEKVIWVNSELGYKNHRYGATLIRAAGNTQVTESVVAGFGHADMVWGTNASTSVWNKFAP